jgi:lipoate-protein ligase B
MIEVDFETGKQASSPIQGVQPVLFDFRGPVSYDAGLDLQDRTCRDLAVSVRDTGLVFGLEHSPGVVTLGKRGRPGDDLPMGAELIEKRGLELRESPRGGQATLHSPGQLVIYPCLHLGRLGLGVRHYVDLLQDATAEYLREKAIETERGTDEPGLYTAHGKIAFFGIKVSRGIASHGIAINVANDLSLFGLIRSCGKDAESFDRVANYLPRETPESAFTSWRRHFRTALSRELLG